MAARRSALRLPPTRPKLGIGIATAVTTVALTTALLYPLGEVAPKVSLGVVYLLAVLLVSTVWGVWLGLATGVLAALAFNYFHIPPTGRFTIAEGENWVALVVLLIAAVATSSVADLARSRALEAEQRRREADLGAELAAAAGRAGPAAGARQRGTTDRPRARAAVGRDRARRARRGGRAPDGLRAPRRRPRDRRARRTA
jgi:two-component system sensor histidine kinase KdpD